MSVGPVTPVQSSQSMQGLTVTCQQCGAANMTRLDRKEYKCNHCGAVTVISDNDAERLEHLLQQVMDRQTPRPPASTAPSNSKVIPVLFTFAGLAFLSAVIGALAYKPAHPMPASSNPVADNYFQHTTVPVDRVVLSPLEWVPEALGGTYNGMIYNHSGYSIMPPSYRLLLFHDGLKDGEASAMPMLVTLEPGEYMPVSFRVMGKKSASRYEVEQPQRIQRGMFEVAPVTLQQATLLRHPHNANYVLNGFIQNTLKRPFSGGGVVMFYGKDGRMIGSGFGYVNDLNPGEKARISMNAFLAHEDAEVASYEYLLDMHYKNERDSVSMQDLEQIGSVTVPSRIVRVSNPQIVNVPDDDSSGTP